MKPRAEKERLLDDVLGGDEAGFRASSFGATMRAARRRQGLRRLGRAGSVLVMVAFAGLFFVWRRTVPPQQPLREAEIRTYELITSQPLPASALVITKPLTADETVDSFASVEIIRTTGSRATPQEIDDGQLLSLLGSTPAALVRHGDHEAELLFVNAADEQRFLRN